MKLPTDIPTALSMPEVVALQQLAQGKPVLEVGALLGYSTIALAQVARSVVSVDPHTGYPAENPRDTWDAFNHNLKRYTVAHKVLPIRGYDCRLDDELRGYMFDLAFIDADGLYNTTRRIIQRAVEHLNPGGLLCVHDYNLPDYPGAGQAVRDWCKATGSHFGTIDTLAIIRPKGIT